MIFLKLLMISMFKDPNLTESLTNLAENLVKNFTLWSLLTLVFPSLIFQQVIFSTSLLNDVFGAQVF